jgi:hypothetical protein
MLSTCPQPTAREPLQHLLSLKPALPSLLNTLLLRHPYPLLLLLELQEALQLRLHRQLQQQL